MTERFVKTSDIYAATEGNEIAVLNAFKVPWKAGQRSHIRCPYPSHGGSSDWRYDEQKKLCFCTCTNKPVKLFSALILVLGENPQDDAAFERVKLEVAERMGWTDLIKTRRGSGPSSPPPPPPLWHEHFKPGKLLNPPDHLRNDDLYFEYMSRRLGVPRDLVPAPATPFVGISSLEYFDQSNGADGKTRKPLCSLPCLVFGMVNHNGDLTGAIRIYLDPTGKDKASLGLDSDGNPRRVKPFTPGTKSGGEIQFGNPKTATVKVCCEGVETGAAVAVAAKADRDDRVLIACAGTASFMAALDRQPGIVRMIAACDRDEAQRTPDKPPSKAGEKAGVTLLTKHHEDVSAALALPGNPGEKVDWLDILRRDGASAVWSGINEAPAFEPPSEPVTAAVIEDEDEGAAARMFDIGSDVELARHALAELEEQHGRILYAEGSFWRYGGTHWVPFDEGSLRLHIHAFDGSTYMTAKGAARIRLSRRQIDSILNEMVPIACQNGKLEPFSEMVPGINCMNGFITFDHEGVPTIVPHSPDHRCRHVIAAKWSGENVTNDRIRGSLLHRLLVGCFKKDPVSGMTDQEKRDAEKDAEGKVKLIAEVMGSAALGMATRITAPKAVVLLGVNAENGKSQVLDIIRGLLPEGAVSSIPAGKMGDEKHVVQLAGKLLNMSDELSSAEAVAGDNFKKIITGNHIEARDVYKSAINFKPKAQHVFATNTLPAFTGGIDRGVRRRLMVIEFNRTIPPSERVPEIGARISTEELDLLLDFAVQGAARLIKQRKFSDLQSSEEAVRKWVLATDPVEAWLEECVVHVTGTSAPRTPTKEAYDAFRQWCDDNGYRLIPSINRFSERIEASGKGYARVRDSKGRYFQGMQIVKDEDAGRIRSFGYPR